MEISADRTSSGQDVRRSFAAGDVVLSCNPWVSSFEYPYYQRICAYCFKESELPEDYSKLKMCSGCSLHRYCGTECQIADWKTDHKRECKMLKEMGLQIRRFREANPNVDKDYRGEFGFCAVEILMAKIINNLQCGKTEQIGLNGKSTARDVLEILPYNPGYDIVSSFCDHTLHALIWPTATLGSIPPDFYQLARAVCYNVFNMRDQAGRDTVIGAGIFPRALHRQMTPVCLSINVTMHMLGRTLVVHATEDIADYFGLKDLRQNELSVNMFASSLMDRQSWIKMLCFGPCTCNKCTPEYDAEINPLKCLTTGCMERIPSDHRALQPCAQCGAFNDQRLQQLKTFMQRNWELEYNVPGVLQRAKLQDGLLLELDHANILHLDAHFRYVLGNEVVRFLIEEKRYEEAWTLCPGLVACVRTIYPQYHLTRANFLRKAGEIPYLWCLQRGKEAVRSHWRGIIEAKVLDWLWEARDIYRKLTGPDNHCERFLTAVLKVTGKITMEITECQMYKGEVDLSRLDEFCHVINVCVLRE